MPELKQHKNEIKERIISDLFRGILEEGTFEWDWNLHKSGNTVVYGYNLRLNNGKGKFKLLSVYPSSHDPEELLGMGRSCLYINGYGQWLLRMNCCRFDFTLSRSWTEKETRYLISRIFKREDVLEYIEERLGMVIDKIKFSDTDWVYHRYKE